MKKVIFTAVFSVAVIAILFFGCSNPSAGPEVSGGDGLQVGFINTDELYYSDPDIQKFFEEKQKEELKIRQKFFSAREQGKMSEQDKEYVKKATVDFMQKQEDLSKQFVDDVRKASLEIMKAKKMDLIINNAGGEVIEYGGVNITEEVTQKYFQVKKPAAVSGDNKKDDNRKNK